MHPRTKQKLESENSQALWPNIQLREPLSYFDNLKAMNAAQCIITDSGGIQKEAYILQKKCITIRSETEWTETLRVDGTLWYGKILIRSRNSD
ncbi:MAG: UDP-N-acetylglucosamine 2-epimerase [Saprospiraceae bacterium]|nr:UDP-N-acetylglucosamine 2-epimerase [Saprospiraceae bacterium]